MGIRSPARQADHRLRGRTVRCRSRKDGAPGADGKDGVSPTVTQLAAGDANCAAGGAAVTDAAGHTAYVCNGADGKDGQPFSGTFTSPNGLFSVSVTDGGITLKSPSASIRVGAALDLETDTAITLRGAALVNVEGGSILLNQGGCAPAARLGDPVNVTGFTGPAPGAPLIDPSGVIGQGSQSVCIGP